MLKYYALMFLIVGVALYYVFLQDPCYSQLRADFFGRHPGYQILTSGASAGSPETVRCHISYRKTDGEQVYEDVWLYQDSGSGWTFSGIIETGKRAPTGEDQEGRPRPRDGAQEASVGGEGFPGTLKTELGDRRGATSYVGLRDRSIEYRGWRVLPLADYRQDQPDGSKPRILVELA